MAFSRAISAPLRFITNNKEYMRASAALHFVNFFSCLGDRLWSFALGLFIADLGGLAWVAIGQFGDNILKMVFLPAVGNYLDKGNRHKGMQLILCCNNLAIAASSVCFYFSLSKTFGDEGTIVLLVVACLFNAVSRVASEAQRSAFQRDWLVCIVDESQVGQLSSHNTLVSGIDQAAALLAPIAAGLAIETLGMSATALLFMGWNLCSWAVEAAIVRKLFLATPVLQQKHEKKEIDEPSSGSNCLNRWTTKWVNAFRIHRRQTCFRPAFALALLYCTVLGFDNLAIAYGTEQSLSPALLGTFRTLGGLVGFLGVLSYGSFVSLGLNVVFVGMIGLVLQNVFLNLCTVSIFLPGNNLDLAGYAHNFTWDSWRSTSYNAISYPQEKPGNPDHGFSWLIDNSPSLLFFYLGIMLARYGLWIADNAIQEIIQQSVPERERNRVSSAQGVYQDFFSLVKDGLVIMFPLAVTFGGLIVFSVSFVAAGFFLYLSYYITEGCPTKRPKSDRSRPEEVEMRMDFKVIEAGVHPELQDLLEKGNGDANGDVEREAPLQTNRTEGL